jgi:hypothetical protein
MILLSIVKRQNDGRNNSYLNRFIEAFELENQSQVT